MQIVSFYIFHIAKGKKLRAFTQMATFPGELVHAEGCTFSKMMGSGHGEGFSIKPNFGVYAAMLVWKDASFINAFETTFQPFLDYLTLTSKVQKIYATPYKFHGTWDQKTPFVCSQNQPPSLERLILTRATIKLSKLYKFWKHVPKTSKAIAKAEGRRFSIGIGEWPWVQQATLSIWDSEEYMKNYAYNNEAHLQAIKMTKDLDWYKEEMFTRFYILHEANLHSN
ncbi:MAG TPA: hypothetical protein PKD85_08715 [Saprospiraceae bacterium]|nr:hypothetical protein [Saprospiraceae bacterium]